MCGITGIVAFSEKGKSSLSKIVPAVNTLRQRGPDAHRTFFHQQVALGHTRLKIIDTSEAASQPFTDESGRYTLVYNGEFYNFREHRKHLEKEGVKFRSASDTEVLLYLFIKEKEKCLEKINGFFAFAIYDEVDQSLFIARDRMGIKPLLYYKDEDQFIFASEMKALLAFDIPRTIDESSLFTYLQLNYIPAPYSIFRGVRKLEPGSYAWINFRSPAKIHPRKFYRIPFTSTLKKPVPAYKEAQENLIELVNESVQRRLIADVPLGTFLSGGIDSGIITATASKYVKNLNTFSIGYKDEPFFDETKYANLVAKKFNTNHTVFKLSNDDLFERLFHVLDYTDEPFADSSAIAVNILCHHTKQKVTVALSGDGADELFSGYNKHTAEYLALNAGLKERIVRILHPVWKALPQSRNSGFGNLVRQLNRFSDGMNLSPSERYWKWASFLSENSAKQLYPDYPNHYSEFDFRKKEILKAVGSDFNSVLYTDMQLVLLNDMLVKVDLMSMANGLEVRVPFLDYTIVNYIFSLPSEYKIDRTSRKKILRDAYKNVLPAELYHRPKHGFEVPLLKWFRTGLKSMITDDLLSDAFVVQQNIFSVAEIRKLKEKLFSDNPGDSPTTIWNLIVFQYWWRKHMN